MEEELAALGANGHILGIAASDNFRLGADILTGSYSDLTSSTRFGSQEFKFGQESQISDGTWYRASDDLEDQTCDETTQVYEVLVPSFLLKMVLCTKTPR